MACRYHLIGSVGFGQVPLHVSCRLAQSLLVLDHCDTDETFALFAIADAGRHGDIGPGQQFLLNLQAAQMGL
jgi:hypothetical protein